jgi:hypothetical protein
MLASCSNAHSGLEVFPRPPVTSIDMLWYGRKLRDGGCQGDDLIVPGSLFFYDQLCFFNIQATSHGVPQTLSRRYQFTRSSEVRSLALTRDASLGLSPTGNSNSPRILVFVQHKVDKGHQHVETDLSIGTSLLMNIYPWSSFSHSASLLESIYCPQSTRCCSVVGFFQGLEENYDSILVRLSTEAPSKLSLPASH